jgi:hypothetical protein
VFQYKSGIYPVEVKAEENLKAKSLKVYSDKYTPAISIRSSMSDYRQDDWLLNLPLYGISQILAECGKFI